MVRHARKQQRRRLHNCRFTIVVGMRSQVLDIDLRADGHIRQALNGLCRNPDIAPIQCKTVSGHTACKGGLISEQLAVKLIAALIFNDAVLDRLKAVIEDQRPLRCFEGAWISVACECGDAK